MGRMPVAQRGEQESDSLGIYMRGLNDLGDYSPEQQNRLCRCFDVASDELRRVVCSMGFIASEYLHSISAILENGSEAADVFVISALRCMGSTKAEQFKVMAQWQQEISEKYHALKDAFAAGKECSVLREELVEILQRYRLTLQRVYELIDVGRNYLRMISPGFESTAFSKTITCAALWALA